MGFFRPRRKEVPAFVQHGLVLEPVDIDALLGAIEVVPPYPAPDLAVVKKRLRAQRQALAKKRARAVMAKAAAEGTIIDRLLRAMPPGAWVSRRDLQDRTDVAHTSIMAKVRAMELRGFVERAVNAEWTGKQAKRRGMFGRHVFDSGPTPYLFRMTPLGEARRAYVLEHGWDSWRAWAALRRGQKTAWGARHEADASPVVPVRLGRPKGRQRSPVGGGVAMRGRGARATRASQRPREARPKRD